MKYQNKLVITGWIKFIIIDEEWVGIDSKLSDAFTQVVFYEKVLFNVKNKISAVTFDNFL